MKTNPKNDISPRNTFQHLKYIKVLFVAIQAVVTLAFTAQSIVSNDALGHFISSGGGSSTAAVLLVAVAIE